MDSPNDAIEEDNSHKVPFRRNPAPNRRVAVHATSARGRNKNEGEGWNQRQDKAENEVKHVQGSQLLHSIASKEYQVHVDRHKKSPVTIHAEEHFDEECLELTKAGMLTCRGASFGDQGSDIRAQIAPGSKEDESIDGFVEA